MALNAPDMEERLADLSKAAACARSDLLESRDIKHREKLMRNVVEQAIEVIHAK